MWPAALLRPKASASRAKPRIGLELVDELQELVGADYPFELEAGTLLVRPDYVRLYPPDDG